VSGDPAQVGLIAVRLCPIAKRMNIGGGGVCLDARVEFDQDRVDDRTQQLWALGCDVRDRN
jgi:hypothetical protein